MRPDAIIKTLEDAGFEARYVGGCVRDTLLDRPIHDWDIASQAQHVLRQRLRGDIPVMDRAAQQRVAHAPADVPRLKPGTLQRL